jgi:DNA-binding transcriptional LysR family regulator
MDLDLLSIFVAVAETSSFSVAAKRLGITTPTVSRGIARLEKLVEAELVHRTTRRVSLSTAGLALLERSATHVRALRESVQGLPEHDEEPSGMLRVAAPYDLGVTLLPELVARFTARYPKVRVEAKLTNRRVDPVAEGVDLVLWPAGGALDDSSLSLRRLVQRADLCFYASPGYLARRGTPRAFAAPEHEWVLLSAGQLLKLPKGFEPRVRANDFLFLRETIRAGAGVGLLPMFVGEPLVVTGELMRVALGVRLPTFRLVLLYPSSGQVARKVVAFRDLLVDAMKKRSFT